MSYDLSSYTFHIKCYNYFSTELNVDILLYEALNGLLLQYLVLVDDWQLTNTTGC